MPLLFGGMGAKARRERAMEMLERVGLGPRATHLPTQLSGGEMQRVAVARALANRPRVILADEPTGNLDSRSGRGIIELFRELWREGVTVVLITHDLGLARVCPRILKIQDGRIVHDGADVPVEDESAEETTPAETVAVASVAEPQARLSGWAKVLRTVRGGRGTRGLEPVRG